MVARVPPGVGLARRIGGSGLGLLLLRCHGDEPGGGLGNLDADLGASFQPGVGPDLVERRRGRLRAVAPDAADQNEKGAAPFGTAPPWSSVLP